MLLIEDRLDADCHSRETASNGVVYGSNRDAVAILLARGESMGRAAELAGVGLRTVSHWKFEEGFRQKIRRDDEAKAIPEH